MKNKYFLIIIGAFCLCGLATLFLVMSLSADTLNSADALNSADGSTGESAMGTMVTLALIWIAGLGAIVWSLTKLMETNQLIEGYFKKEVSETGIPLPPSEIQSTEFGDQFTFWVNQVQSLIDLKEVDQDNLLMSTKIQNYNLMQMRSVLDSLPLSVMMLDESGVTTYCNNNLSRLFNKSAADIYEKQLSEWCENKEIVSFLTSYLGNVAKLYRGQLMQFAPINNPEKTIKINVHPLFSNKSSDKLLGTLVVFSDISREVDSKNMSGEFVANIAHELKTPLNVLRMYSETLVDSGIDDPEVVESLNIIYDEVDRMAILINNLLNISKIELGDIALEKQRIKMQDFLQDVFNNISRSGKDSNLRFSVELEEIANTVIVADKDLLRIAINNLLTNAIKYNRESGEVSLKAEQTEEEVIIRVKDTGLGISDDEQKRIFDKFYRVNSEDSRAQSGHGLGLTLAMNIVQLHHAKLTVKSVLGEGTEFKISFKEEFGILEKAS